MKLKEEGREEKRVEGKWLGDGRREDLGMSPRVLSWWLYSMLGPVWKGGLCKALKPLHYHHSGEVQYTGELLQLPIQPPTDKRLHNELPFGPLAFDEDVNRGRWSEASFRRCGFYVWEVSLCRSRWTGKRQRLSPISSSRTSNTSAILNTSLW